MAAAGLLAAQTAKTAGAEAAGILKSVINALEKPIYSNLKVDTATWQSNDKTGTVHTTVHTHGWTIPLGVPVLVVGSIALWEVGNFIAQGLAKVAGVVPDIALAMSPASWVIEGANIVATDISAATNPTLLTNLANYLLNNKGKTTAAADPPPAGVAVYTRPPTAMASLSNLVQNFVDPIAATAGSYGPKLVGALASKT